MFFSSKVRKAAEQKQKGAHHNRNNNNNVFILEGAKANGTATATFIKFDGQSTAALRLQEACFSRIKEIW